MTRYTLHVPEQYNDGSPVSPEYFAVIEREIEDIAGGWTLTHGIGGWRGEDARYREPVRLYAVDTERAPDRLLDLADDIAAALGQEAVYLTAQAINTTLVTRGSLDREMAVDFAEHFAYQNAQARAHATGKLTTEEAQVIYIALGEVGSADNGGWAADTDTPTKVAVTLAMGELLRR